MASYLVAEHLMKVYVESLRWEQYLREIYLSDFSNDGKLWKAAVEERVQAYRAWEENLKL